MAIATTTAKRSSLNISPPLCWFTIKRFPLAHNFRTINIQHRQPMKLYPNIGLFECFYSHLWWNAKRTINPSMGCRNFQRNCKLHIGKKNICKTAPSHSQKKSYRLRNGFICVWSLFIIFVLWNLHEIPIFRD